MAVNEFQGDINFKPLHPRQHSNLDASTIEGLEGTEPYALSIMSSIYTINDGLSLTAVISSNLNSAVAVATTGAQALLQSCGMFPRMRRRNINFITL